MHTILILGGSLRRASWNQRVAEIAGEGAARDGMQIVTLQLADFPLPMFNQDTETEDGNCTAVQTLRGHFWNAQGLILGVPEYNGGPPAALKNAIDWLSRPVEGHASLDCFTGKVCGLVSASPGGLGGVRGLPITRTILSGIGMHVLPNQIAVGNVTTALKDEAVIERIHAVGDAVATAVHKLHS